MEKTGGLFLKAKIISKNPDNPFLADLYPMDGSPKRRSTACSILLPIICSSYPDRPPVGPYERYMAHLDQQTFPSHLFACVDDILMGAFFKTKRRCRSYRAGLMSVQTGWTSAWVTDAELMTIHCQMEQPGPQERLAVVVLIYRVSLA